MNWDRIEGNWKQIGGKVREQWGKLTDDDFDVAAGKRDQLAGRVQERYMRTEVPLGDLHDPLRVSHHTPGQLFLFVVVLGRDEAGQ